MNNTSHPHKQVEYDQPVETEVLRPHVFDDSIQEYDKRMPNWWLVTLYGAIAFSVVYWVVSQPFAKSSDPGLALKKQMEESVDIAARKSGVLTNELLWKMSRDSQVTEAGKATFLSTCAVCHQPDLSGKIGPSLLHEKWIHGGQPLEIINTITTGVPAKGMPTWGPVLGKQKITEVAAFILSHHSPPPAGSTPPTASAVTAEPASVAAVVPAAK
jgi:cytochrome c oxidase cbb3-type subunit 3